MWNNIGQLQQKEVNKMLEEVINSGINFITPLIFTLLARLSNCWARV